ncbi:diguanylate cyclase domain protein [Lyngbya aestuarii BL J]|uniref:Diguanylate cyclase domain protein n=1 Tax=Lyngbya aestuarii BL J TaxID=1348334 RepID=U7QG37_9CYAN|nr:diguanylate cyclase [Lyngbya aestuarii]ERT06909.1 diguanylate cyclase domain protein [Lyngbya aestuarii BL J]
MNCILLLVAHKENCNLLVKLLEKHYQVLLDENEQIWHQDFDLCLLDGVMLKKHYPSIQIKNKASEPIFLPFLFITPREYAGRLTAQVWQSVDEVIFSPIEKPELFLRIEALLRVRRMSLQLKKQINEEHLLQQELEAKNKQLLILATLDGLTQIPNRRCFDETLNQEWLRLCREQKSLFLILCDIDCFKNYNDTFGHLAGDECLIKVAQTLYEVVRRPADLVARYGGEEFAIILPNTSAEGAIYIAERIQEAIQELAIPHSASLVSSSVTLSMGIAGGIPCCEESPLSLIDISDQALYQAKMEGKNRFILKPLKS